MIKRRIQLTLFINKKNSEPIEKIRKEFNPKQYALIKSHVTLCREDELEQISTILQTLTDQNYPEIAIDFGPVQRFANGNGVLIPAIGDNNQFQELRKHLLRKIISLPKKQEPHITLMHPRNSTCTNNTFEQIVKVKIPDKLVFSKVSLIEQEGENAWEVIKEFDLQKTVF